MVDKEIGDSIAAEESPKISPIPEPPVDGVKGWKKTFRAFSYRDYRLLWSGSFTSSCGTWMQEVAQNWLIFDMTGSAFWLGLDAFLGDAPFILFSLLGGVVADRYDRRKILLGSQLVQLTNAFALGALVFFHQVQIWHILVLSFLTGVAQSFGGPAYQALVPTLVDKEDVPNAVSLQSTQFNLARVVGPLLAAAAFQRYGAPVCFGLNGLSFFVVIAALLVMRNRFVRRSGKHPPVMQSLRESLAFVRRTPAMTALIFLAFAGSFLAFPLLTFLPVFAKAIFGRDVRAYGRFLTFFGVGAVLGAVAAARLSHSARKGVRAVSAQIVFASLVVAFALSRTFTVSCVLLFLAGAALSVVFTMLISLVQTVVADEMRGRVGSVYMLAFRGAIPLGNVIAGAIAARTSVTAVLVVNGVFLAMISSSVLLFRRSALVE
ncbi:MAG: MFS transporter [Thermoanaerobaculia bacterium]